MHKTGLVIAMALGLASGAAWAGEKSTGGIGSVIEIYPVYTVDDRVYALEDVSGVVTPRLLQNARAVDQQSGTVARHPFGTASQGAGRGGIVKSYLQSLDR